MTRKDYVALAKAIASVTLRENGRIYKDELVRRIAGVLSNNPRFDYGKFVAACSEGTDYES